MPSRKITCKWCSQKFPLSTTIDGVKCDGWDLLKAHVQDDHFFDFLNEEVNAQGDEWFTEKLHRFTIWLKEREATSLTDEITKFGLVWLKNRLYKKLELLDILQSLENLGYHHDNFYIFRNAWIVWDTIDEEIEMLEDLEEYY